MAQLVKIQDYVSRYEKNLYHYQSLFMRLKEKRLKSFLHKYEESRSPQNKEQAMKNFREFLFNHQLNWATSTVKEVSVLEPRFENDSTLKFLSQEIPDNYFLIYEPVLQVKSAPVELDIILVGPAAIWLIVWMDGKGIWQEAENKRFWNNVDSVQKETRLSPLIRLDRMKKIIGEMAAPFQEQLVIKNTVIAPESYIDLPVDWRKINYIDKRNFKEWHRQVIHEPAPVKSQQLKFVSVLLENSVTNSLTRKDPLTDEFESSMEGNE
jgi:hypothetical protein